MLRNILVLHTLPQGLPFASVNEGTHNGGKRSAQLGFDIKRGEHLTVPIMLYDSVLAAGFADALLKEGIYVIGFFYRVVAKGQARIRVQISAAHEQHHLDKAIEAFTKIGKELGVLK